MLLPSRTIKCCKFIVVNITCTKCINIQYVNYNCTQMNLCYSQRLCKHSESYSMWLYRIRIDGMSSSHASFLSLYPDWWRVVISQGGVIVSHGSDQLRPARLHGWRRRPILPCKRFLLQSHGILRLFTRWESFSRGSKEVKSFKTLL